MELDRSKNVLEFVALYFICYFACKEQHYQSYCFPFLEKLRKRNYLTRHQQMPELEERKNPLDNVLAHANGLHVFMQELLNKNQKNQTKCKIKPKKKKRLRQMILNSVFSHPRSQPKKKKAFKTIHR